jgi:hypothetical protein
MPYGLRYTISQILRNENTQIIEIYEQDYVAGIVKTYIPSSITLQPNSSEEYPYPTIISTQLNFNIILETQDDYDQFPDVLSKNDRKYWVVYKEGATVIWRGFLFNDYAQIGFSTGINEASLVCIDGISFLQDQVYQFEVTDSINTTQQWLDLIFIGLRFLGYPEDLYLVIACSFYAEGMLNRSDGDSNEPFAQTYQYRRDFIGVSFYDIIENMLRTYNCRMYQANGDWWIASTMEVAAPTRYFTKYNVGVYATIDSSGVLDNVVNIAPYQYDNVHFIDNTQTKILRKGFYNIELRNRYTSPINLIHNANLQDVIGVVSPVPIYPLSAYGWFTTLTGTAEATVIIYPDEQLNSYYLSAGTGDAYLEILSNVNPYLYTPYLGGFPLNLSIEHKNSVAIKIQIALLSTGSGNKYLDNSGNWQTNANTYITFPAWDGKKDWSSFSLTIPPFLVGVFSTTFLMGYLNIKILCNTNSTEVRNFVLTQAQTDVQYAVVSNSSTEDKSTQKIFEVPYGQIYPTTTGQQVLTLGSLYNSNGIFLENWYFEYLLIDRTLLFTFLAYQYIKIYQRNIATLEGDLGSIQADNGYLNLDKVYTITDASTGNLSYNGKQFAINRLTTNSYYNQVNGIQLIEIYFDEEATATFIQYITNTGQLGPFWNYNFNINL